MYQVQGQLHITEKELCYFVVYTHKEFKYCIIQRDDKFWAYNMVEPLEKFYLYALLPEIVDSRYKRSQPIRQILKKKAKHALSSSKNGISFEE